MKNNYCYIVDSGMQVIKVKQDKIQKLLDNKDIAPLDINEQIGNEDITDLLEYLITEYKLYNKYDLQYIVDYFNDIICDIESREENV